MDLLLPLINEEYSKFNLFLDNQNIYHIINSIYQNKRDEFNNCVQLFIDTCEDMNASKAFNRVISCVMDIILSDLLVLQQNKDYLKITELYSLILYILKSPFKISQENGIFLISVIENVYINNLYLDCLYWMKFNLIIMKISLEW